MSASYSRWRCRAPDDALSSLRVVVGAAGVARAAQHEAVRCSTFVSRCAASGTRTLELTLIKNSLCPPSAAHRGLLGRRLAAEHAIAGRGEAANQPVRLDRVVHPGGRPAVGHTRLDGLFRHFSALPVEKRQLSAGLRQSPLEVAPLRLARPYATRITAGQILAPRADVVLALRCSTHRPPAVNDD